MVQLSSRHLLVDLGWIRCEGHHETLDELVGIEDITAITADQLLDRLQIRLAHCTTTHD